MPHPSPPLLGPFWLSFPAKCQGEGGAVTALERAELFLIQAGNQPPHSQRHHLSTFQRSHHLQLHTVPACVARSIHFSLTAPSLCVCLAAQLCPTLCNSRDCSPPGFFAHGILQVRILSGLPFPSPEGLPDPGIEPWSPALQADSLHLSYRNVHTFIRCFVSNFSALLIPPSAFCLPIC